MIQNELRIKASMVCERGFWRSKGLTWAIIGSHDGGFVHVLHCKGPVRDRLRAPVALVLHLLGAHVGTMSAITGAYLAPLNLEATTTTCS